MICVAFYMVDESKSQTDISSSEWDLAVEAPHFLPFYIRYLLSKNALI